MANSRVCTTWKLERFSKDVPPLPLYYSLGENFEFGCPGLAIVCIPDITRNGLSVIKEGISF